MEAKKIIEILENEMNKTSGEWVEIYEKKEFFKNIITLIKKEEDKPQEDNIIKVGKDGIIFKCPGCGYYNLLSKMIWKKGMAKCRGKNCDWRFKITWGGKPEEKIYKTKPKGAGEYTPINYSIPHGKDKDGKWRPWTFKRLKIGDLYDIVTDEHGQEIYITARFVGWKKDVFIRDDGKILPGNISYLALFEAVGYIEVDTDYSLSITKSEEEGEKRDE